MTLSVSTPRVYPVARTVLEHHALDLQRHNPSLHLSMACQLALEQHPVVWRVYREGIRHGLAPEFQRPKRRPSRPTPVDRAYFVIEDIARALIASSETAITLRSAVVRVVETNPRLLDAYRRAIRRKRRDRSAGRRK